MAVFPLHVLNKFALRLVHTFPFLKVKIDSENNSHIRVNQSAATELHFFQVDAFCKERNKDRGGALIL